jgi:hypothetical protein
MNKGDLLPEFLSLVYGEKLYSIPDFKQPAIKIIHKPNAGITFFVREAEMQRKDLMELLKKIVEAMKIPFPEVSFGRMVRPAQRQDFESMKTPYGVILDLNYFPLDPGLDNRTDFTGLYVLPCLADMQENESVKRKSWTVLKRLSELYQIK